MNNDELLQALRDVQPSCPEDLLKRHSELFEKVNAWTVKKTVTKGGRGATTRKAAANSRTNVKGSKQNNKSKANNNAGSESDEDSGDEFVPSNKPKRRRHQISSDSDWNTSINLSAEFSRI